MADPVPSPLLEGFPRSVRMESQVAGGIRLYDATEALSGFAERQYPERDAEAIEALFIHHSGALGRPGWDGLLAHVRYVTAEWGRGWPDGSPYTFWAPHHPVRDRWGSLCVLRLQPDNRRTYHTGGRANDIGVALALQGNTSTDGLSPSQVEILEGFLPWAMGRYGLTHAQIAGHAESEPWGGSGKPSCPGSEALAWLQEWRGGDVAGYGTR